MEVNTQPVSKQILTDDGSLLVIKVWRTIQGEGPFAGRSSVFVRLAGCNLQCPLCDTQYTKGAKAMTPADLLQRIRDVGKSWDIVVITGGEPFRQNLLPFLKVLYLAGRTAQVETNGTVFYDVSDDVDHAFGFWSGTASIVCSPKTPLLDPRLVPYVFAYKYVLEHGFVSPLDGLPVSVLGNHLRVARPPHNVPAHKVFVQPLDEQDAAMNKLHLQTAADSALEFGYRLCVQMHKYAGLE